MRVARSLCLSAMLPAFLLSAGASARAATGVQAFSTPGEHAFTVPAGVSSLEVTLIGGNGGAGRLGGSAAGAPGQGATVMAAVAVTPGEVLYAEVAGDGEDGYAEGAGGPGTGGGGKGGGIIFVTGGGGGGGASDLRTCALACGAASLPTRLLVAAGGAGGGGEGGPAAVAGGPGGSADRSGTNGSINATLQAGEGGKRGTASAGGTGGAVSFECPSLATCSEPGGEGAGGAGGSGSGGGGGGGGGGGIFGGGGGGGGEGFEFKPGQWENAGGGGGGGGSSGVPAAGAGRVSGFLQLLTALGAEPSISISWTIPASAPGGGGPSPASTVTTAGSRAPVLSGFRLSPSRFRRGPHPATISSAGVPTGTTIAFALSAAAAVTVSVEQPHGGVRAGARCVPASRGARRGRPCARWVRLARRIVRQAHAGTDRIRFDGVLDGAATLSPGRYRLSLKAADAGGSTSAAGHPGFTLLP